MERSRMRMPGGRTWGRDRADHDGTARRGRAARGPDGAFRRRRLLAGLDQGGRRGLARVQVEARARSQDVHDEADDADRLAIGRAAPRGGADLRGVDDRDAARALDLECLVGPDEGGRVLVEPEAHRERVVGERGDEAAEAVALAEMLVDDEAVGEPEARREADAARDRGRAVVAEGDHVLGEDRGAGARAADGDAARVLRADQLRDRRAGEERREPELVAAREEDAGGILDAVEASLLLAVAPRVEVHDVDAARAELAEEPLVAAAGLVRAARGRDHDDVGVVAARDRHEAREDLRVVFFVLGAADRDDVAARLAFGYPARTHGISLRAPT